MSDDEPLSPVNRYEVEDEDEESEEEENNESQASNIERDASSSPEREVEEILFGGDVPSEDEEGEDLINDNMFQDYEHIAELDYYEPEHLDNTEYPVMSAEQRRAAEKEMKRRVEGKPASKKRKKPRTESQYRGRQPSALLEVIGEDDSENSEEDDMGPVLKRRKEGELPPDFEEQVELDLNAEPEKGMGPIREWVVKEAPRAAIAKAFRTFLKTLTDSDGHSIYGTRIRNMCVANQSSLQVSYVDLAQGKNLYGVNVDMCHAAVSAIARYLVDAPTEVLKILDDAATRVILEIFPEYKNIANEIHVRITDLPVSDSLRSLRKIHLNSLVKVPGVVTRRSSVFPQLGQVKYDCSKCGFIIGPYIMDPNSTNVKIGSCPQCQGKGPFTVNIEQTIYRNYQKITLQESPGSVPPGRLPRTKEVILTGDLIDSARPGEEIEVTGVYKNSYDSALNSAHGFPVFSTVIEANFISKKDDYFSSFRLTEDDEKHIREIAKDPRIGKKIIASIAPSIYAHEDIKTAIALSLFGGESKELQNHHRIRGDINVLVLGDPGTAKSQFLKYVEKTAHRAVYTTGQGASAVGLTAAVRKDTATREWTLEGGALVLADNGVCLIDEFDKMNDKDRTSIHEAMEQQSISISKAGIVTSLRARCAVIAAANPIKGRYDSSVSFATNVDLGLPILSRFDILCVVRDLINPVTDEQLAEFVVNSHCKSHPEELPPGTTVDCNSHKFMLDEEEQENTNKEIIPQEVLRKYILYAKQKVHPKLSNMDQDKVKRMYSELRTEAMNSGVPVTVRFMESIIRMAEAHAKMHLREYVIDYDVNLAIRVALQSFITAQKYSVAQVLRKKFHKYITYNKDYNELLFFLLQQMVREAVSYYQVRHATQPTHVEISKDDFEARGRELHITNMDGFYKSDLFKKNSFFVDAKKRSIKKVFGQ